MSFLEKRAWQQFVVVGDTVTDTTTGLERERHFVAHVAVQRDGHFVRDVVAAIGAATTLY